MQGSQGGTGISAETAVASASATPASKKTFFSMLKSPCGFELNSGNARIHEKIKRSGLD
jgi:hypothetical protein